MIRFLCVFFGSCLLLACSSKPKQNYDVTTLQSISYALMDLADSKRQQENYPQALLLYQEADKYSVQRNDKYLLGLSKLKQASIHIKTSALKEAELLINEAREMAVNEVPRLEPAVKFLQAQWYVESGNTSASESLYLQLIERFKGDAVRSAYYQMAWWQHIPTYLTLAQATALLERVEKIKNDGELENVEIYSFMLLQYTKRVLQADEVTGASQAKAAIAHFTSLEQTAKIKQIYSWLSAYLARSGQIEQSDYYQRQVETIETAIN